jgi:hypothetical protein
MMFSGLTGKPNRSRGSGCSPSEFSGLRLLPLDAAIHDSSNTTNLSCRLLTHTISFISNLVIAGVRSLLGTTHLTPAYFKTGSALSHHQQQTLAEIVAPILSDGEFLGA